MKTKYLVAGLLAAFLAGAAVGMEAGLWLTDQPLPAQVCLPGGAPR